MENVVGKETMESLKALADINLKVSEAKNLLFKLEEQETEYLIAREKKVMDRIKKVVDDSQEMVNEADKNYGQIKELLENISGFCNLLINTQEQFNTLIETFNQRNELWEKHIGEQQDGIEENRKLIKVHSQIIENDKKSISISKESLENQKRHLESQQASLLASYTVEKELWDKLKGLK